MKFRQYSLRFFFFFFLFTYFYCILDFFKNKVMSDVGIKARASLNFTFPPTSSPPKPPAPTPLCSQICSQWIKNLIPEPLYKSQALFP